MPKKKENDVSVYRTTLMKEINIRYIAFNQLKRAKKIYGRAEIRAKNVYAKTLHIQPEISRHFRHANIVGWPIPLDAQRHLANALALKASRIIWDAPLIPRK